MKKIYQSFLVALGLCLLLSGFSTPAGASDVKSIEVKREDAVYDESLGAYIIPFIKVDGELVQLNQEEFDELNEQTLTIEEAEALMEEAEQLPGAMEGDDISPFDNYREWYTYTENTNYNVTGSTTYKVSAELDCTNLTRCDITKLNAATISATYSVGLVAEKDAIKANAGFSWTESATSSTSYRFQLVKGEKGYVGFTPYLRLSNGALHKYSNWDGLISSRAVYAYSPKTTSTGEADGIYKLVFTR